MMSENIATDLSGELWNSIADQIARSASPREIYFVKVKKADKKKLLIWTEDFGDMGIPLVSFTTTFAYFDTQPTGANVVAGTPLPTKKVKREDKTQVNPAFQATLICPKVGQTVVVLDPWGAKRFPFCIGVIQSKQGFWEET